MLLNGLYDFINRQSRKWNEYQLEKTIKECKEIQKLLERRLNKVKGVA